GSALGRGGKGMKEKERSVVVGVFGTREEAERGMAELRTAGFEDSHLTMVMHHDNQGVEVTDLDRAKAARITGESKAEEGAALGGAVGAVAGGLLGLIPGIGPVFLWGPTLAATLFGLVGGAATGGIAGALIGSDIPEEAARFYEAELKAGRVLVGVRVDGR